MTGVRKCQGAIKERCAGQEVNPAARSVDDAR